MTYSIAADLSTKEIGGELFIYNRKNSTIYSFNGTGVFIWNSLVKRIDSDEIGRLLCQDYDVSATEATKDVSEFVENLLLNGLVKGDAE